jgi:hypothetical protein
MDWAWHRHDRDGFLYDHNHDNGKKSHIHQDSAPYAGWWTFNRAGNEAGQIRAELDRWYEWLNKCSGEAHWLIVNKYIEQGESLCECGLLRAGEPFPEAVVKDIEAL